MGGVAPAGSVAIILPLDPVPRSAVLINLHLDGGAAVVGRGRGGGRGHLALHCVCLALALPPEPAPWPWSWSWSPLFPVTLAAALVPVGHALQTLNQLTMLFCTYALRKLESQLLLLLVTDVRAGCTIGCHLPTTPNQQTPWIHPTPVGIQS